MNQTHFPVNDVVICCFRKDIHLAKICVASVRYWYPDIQIHLLKDTAQGDFDTSEMEQYYQAKILPTQGKFFGWGYTKLEAFFAPLPKFLLLDSDTILTGPVLDRIGQIDADFVVCGVEDPDPQGYDIERHYMNVARIREVVPDFHYPGYGINTGQLIVTPGKIRESDFMDMLERTPTGFRERHPGMFRYADQGLINYVLARGMQENRFQVAYHNFWRWSELDEVKQLSLTDIQAKQAPAWVIHWAGTKRIYLQENTRFDLLDFFYDLYYTQVPQGSKRKRAELARLNRIAWFKTWRIRIRKMLRF